MEEEELDTLLLDEGPLVVTRGVELVLRLKLELVVETERLLMLGWLLGRSPPERPTPPEG